MAQPVGLVVEPVVLNRLGVFPESATTVLADWQQRLEQLLEDQLEGEQWLSAAPSFELFCQEVLAWQPGDLRKPEELAAPVPCRAVGLGNQWDIKGTLGNPRFGP